MILFKQDWYKYPTAKPHWSTTNKTWVELATKYKMMGVDNNVFHLALINPELAHVNPFDENISDNQMLMIAEECYHNPWYFFRECVRVPAQAGVGSSPLEANRGNIALWWSFFNHITVFLMQIRQTGKSLSTDCLMTYLLNILCSNTSINLLTKDDNLRRENVERMKNVAAELPPFLFRGGTKEDANNGEEITVRALGNHYNTHVPQASEKRANNLGRGLTTAIIHIDELPFCVNIGISYPAMITATNAAVDEAKVKGEPYGIIITSTAGKKDDRDGKFGYKLYQDGFVFNEKIFDAKDQDELRKIIVSGSRSKEYLMSITMNHKQLGKTDEWLKEKIKASRGTPEDIRRDYFNEWTSGGLSSPFSVEVAEKIASSRSDPTYIYIDPKCGYVLNFYIKDYEIEAVLQNNKTVLSIDSSDMGGGDDLGLVIVDTQTLDVIATAVINETNIHQFSEWLCEFIIRYENITTIIERRSTGSSIIDHLLWILPSRGIDPFKRLYNRVVNDYLEYPDRYKNVVQVPFNRRPQEIYVGYKNQFGFSTSGSGMSARSGLYSTTMHNGIRMSGSRLKDRTLINQLLTLEIRNGRVDHPMGEHDDIVIAWLLSIWLLTQGQNLQFYGIGPNDLLSRIKEREVTDPRELHVQREQTRIKDEINLLLKQLESEADEFICERIEGKLRLLERSVIKDDGSVESIDELIRRANETRRNSVRRVRNSVNTGIDYMQMYRSGNTFSRMY